MNRKNYIAVVLLVFSIGALIIILYPFLLSGDLLKKDLQNYSALILAFLTYIYVLLTYFILRANNKAVSEQLRPYVILTFPISKSFVYLSLKNIGQRPALNVKVEISNGLNEFLVDSVGENYINIFKQNFIAPNQEIKHFYTDVGYIYSPQNKDATKKFEINISYQDSEGKKYPLEYTIDFSTLLDVKGITTAESEIDNQLENIHRELEKLNKSIDNYLRRV